MNLSYILKIFVREEVKSSKQEKRIVVIEKYNSQGGASNFQNKKPDFYNCIRQKYSAIKKNNKDNGFDLETDLSTFSQQYNRLQSRSINMIMKNWVKERKKLVEQIEAAANFQTKEQC